MVMICELMDIVCIMLTDWENEEEVWHCASEKYVRLLIEGILESVAVDIEL